MKKKVALLLTIAALCITMTGCSFELPFKKDKVDETEDVSSTDGAVGTSIEVMNGATFTVGSTISIYDLVKIPEDMGSPVMAALIDESGMVYETISADTVGDFTYEVAIDFENGDSYGDVVSFSVTDGSNVSSDDGFDDQSGNVEAPADVISIPAELSYNIDNDPWSSFFIPTTNVEDDEMALIDSSVIVSGDSNNVEFTYPYGIIPIEDAVIDMHVGGAQYILNIGYIDYSLESLLDERGLSPLKDAHTYAKAGMDLILGPNSESDTPPEDRERLKNYYHQFLDDVTTVRTGDTGYKMYDSNGQEYQVNVVLEDVDLNKVGIEGYDKFTTALFYYIEYGNGYIVIGVPYTIDTQYAITSDSSEEEYEENTEIPTNYEDFCSMLIPSDDFIAIYFWDNVDEAQSIISDICNSMIIGDYSVLKSSEPVDEEGSVEIDGTEDGEDVEEELNGAAGKVVTYYSDRYPDLYDYWPQKNNVYRRWVYNISDDTTYVGSIIPRDADGVIQVGGATVTIPDNYDDAPEVNDGDDEYGNNQTDSSQLFTLSSSYNTYSVSNGGKSNLTFNTSASTSGRLSLQYNGTRYYIETVRASQINNYISECIYSTSTFKDNSFTVVDGGNSVNTDIGTITQYIIRFEDLNGNQQELPYMAVYNISNDYLCVYADALPTSNSNIFVEMLRDMISIQ